MWYWKRGRGKEIGCAGRKITGLRGKSREHLPRSTMRLQTPCIQANKHAVSNNGLRQRERGAERQSPKKILHAKQREHKTTLHALKDRVHNTIL